MAKYCPKCGIKVEDEHVYCPECGTSLPNSLNDTNSIKEKMSNQLPKKTNNNKGNGRRNKIIIIGITILIIVGIIAGAYYYYQYNSEKVLKIGDLQLNMTGYTYEETSNSSVTSGVVNGQSYYYKVDGHGDSFYLTVVITEDTFNLGNLGDSNVTVNGGLNAVAVTKYINGKYYWIQLSYCNDEHCTADYLNSIIITQGTTPPTTDTGTSTTTNTNDDDGDDSGSHEGKTKTRYCTTHGRVAVVQGTLCPQCLEEGLDARTVVGSTEWI